MAVQAWVFITKALISAEGDGTPVHRELEWNQVSRFRRAVRQPEYIIHFELLMTCIGSEPAM